MLDEIYYLGIEGSGGYWYRRKHPVTGEVRPQGPFYTRQEAIDDRAWFRDYVATLGAVTGEGEA